MKNQYQKYYARREINPAFILNQIGKDSLKRVMEKEKHIKLNIITTQLMCAFTMEAVLNHVGSKIFRNRQEENVIWKLIEKSEPKDKLLAIIEKLNIKVDFNILPFSDFSSFFTFRNQIVHGKTTILLSEDIKDKQIDEDNFPILESIPELQAKWEKIVSPKNAERWRDSVYKISEILSDHAKCYDAVRIGDFIDTSGELKR